MSLQSVTQDDGPPRRGRIARNWNFVSFMTTKQKIKGSINTKKEKCIGSQTSSCERTLLDLSLKKEVYKEVYFRTASASFSSNSAAIFFAFVERDWTLLSCFSADGKTADILMLMFIHDRFTHAT